MMRELTEQELSFVFGGGALDADGSFGQGVGIGIDGGGIMDHTTAASKDPANNPGFDNSVIGGIWNGVSAGIHNAWTGTGAPNPSDINPMGDFTGGSADNGGPNQGGNR